MTFRRIDELGRIVLPSEMRSELEINSNSILNIRLEQGKIIIENASQCCKLCGSPDYLTMTEHGPLCAKCIKTIKAL